MIEFSVKNDITKTLAKFPWVQGDAIPKLVSNVLNSTAYHTAIKIKEEMPNAFDKPTPYTQRAVYAWRGNPTDLNAEVRVRDFAAKGVPAIKFLGPEIYGGTRGYKASEKALIAAGILPNGMYIVPANGAPLDQYGNLRGPYMNRIISYLRANRDSTQNRSQKGKGRPLQFFAISTHDRLPMGIYERSMGKIRMVIAFVQAPHYKQRLDYFGIAERFAQGYFPDKLRREAEYLTRTEGAKFSNEAITALGEILKG